jgi:hypothetical protein
MMTGKWVKAEDFSDHIIWQNKKDKSLTIEAHQFDEEDTIEIGAEWYVFPAKNGKGIPSSPYHAINKQDALREIKRLKEVI